MVAVTVQSLQGASSVLSHLFIRYSIPAATMQGEQVCIESCLHQCQFVSSNSRLYRVRMPGRYIQILLTMYLIKREIQTCHGVSEKCHITLVGHSTTTQVGAQRCTDLTALSHKSVRIAQREICTGLSITARGLERSQESGTNSIIIFQEMPTFLFGEENMEKKNL